VRALSLKPIGCTPAVSVTNSAAAAAVRGLWRYMCAGPLPLRFLQYVFNFLNIFIGTFFTYMTLGVTVTGAFTVVAGRRTCFVSGTARSFSTATHRGGTTAPRDAVGAGSGNESRAGQANSVAEGRFQEAAKSGRKKEEIASLIDVVVRLKLSTTGDSSVQ